MYRAYSQQNSPLLQPGKWLLAALVCIHALGCQRAGPLLSEPDTPQADEPYPFYQPENFPEATFPDDNRLTTSRVNLGKRLFFDPVLSRDGSISCGSCHLPEKAFTDGRQLSAGVAGRLGMRNAPSLVNMAFLPRFFNWDGGTPSLELQALVPLESHLEMDLPVHESVERLRADPDYVERFRMAYGTEPTVGSLTRALAAYTRTLVSADSRYDQYVRSGNQSHLTDAELRGMELFNNEKGDCFHCHGTDLFTSNGFHNTAITATIGDRGRGQITLNARDDGKFKVPSLRNVALTAPYMHNGSMATLEEVVRHYNRGGHAENPNKDPLMRPLNLSEQEIVDLVAFLNALTDEEFLERHRQDNQQP
ncbi:MAG: c-type cytochrome [Bacteroidetes bacterium]|jgi:cytochrome c peroxidase|nr:c-type cytochrome [Bacteroidota bacterium]